METSLGETITLSHLMMFIFFAIGMTGTLLIGSLSWSRSLQRQVKNRTDELRKSEQRFRLLYMEAPLSYQSLDTNGRILDVNPAWIEALGYARDEIVGHWFGEILVQASVERFRRVFERVKQDGTIRGAELEIICKNGRKKIVSLEGRLAKDEQNRFLQVHCIFQDITEQRKAESAMRQSEEKFSKAFHISPDAITITRLKDGQYLDINEGFSRITGYQPEEVLGKSSNEIEIWARPEDRAKMVLVLVRTGEVWDYEARLKTKDGRIRTALVSARLLEIGGEQCILTMTRDITERKQAEAEIVRQVERLAALRAIDTAITTSAGLQETLEILLKQVTRQLKIDAASVLIYNPKSKLLEYYTCCDMQPIYAEKAILELDETLAGAVVKTGEPVMIDNLAEMPGDIPEGMSPGLRDFTLYYAFPLVAKSGFKGILEIYHRTAFTPNADWMSFLQALTSQAAIAIENAMLLKELQLANRELKLAYDKTIQGWARALELRDVETEGHSQRVTKMAVELAQYMGVSGEDLVHMRRGALLHDIGKMGIPDNVLLKAGPLNPGEMAVMRQHTTYARELLSSIDFLGRALDIPYYHHERWDGEGYPERLKGEEIPLIARIFSIIDVWDALCSDRPYRGQWTKERSLAYLREQSGKQFDPMVVEAFLRSIEEKQSVHFDYMMTTRGQNGGCQ